MATFDEAAVSGLSPTWRSAADPGSRPELRKRVTCPTVGTGTAKDRGTIDANGKFQPSVAGTDSPTLVRAVKLSLLGS
jgi:hypothetical protein